MFYNCKNIIEIDLSLFSSEKIENKDLMFSGCNIKYLDLYSFQTNNVTSMKNLFTECYYLKMVDLLNFNNKNIFINNRF